MSDHALIGLFLHKREVYDNYESTVPQHLLEPETQAIMEDIGKWYAKNQHETEIVPRNIAAFWEYCKLVLHPNLAAPKLEAIKVLVKKSVAAGASASAAQILQSLVLRDHAGRMAEKCDKYSSGQLACNLYDELLDDVEQAQQQAGIHTSHSQEVSFDLNRIMDSICNLSTGLHWRSPNLEMALGPIRKGNFIMFAGFVDSGKTTLLASEVSYMASQLPPGKKVLYFNNEEGGDTVAAKLVQATIGWTVEDIDKNRVLAERHRLKNLNGEGDKIVLIDSADGPITPGLIRKKLRQYDVGLMVFDQLYKVKGFKRHGDDKLGQIQDIFEYGRNLAKAHCPVIAVHQARGDANGCEKIEMHQLAGSQQALQGELDAIITIGRNLNMPGMRYLYVPKNKLPTPGDPNSRNGFFEIEPKFAIARFDE